MTREQARQFGISLLEGIAERNTGEYAENVRLAIAALTEPILVPDNLDVTAQKVEDYYDVGEEHGYLYCHRGDIKDAFKAGAKWMAEQGVTVIKKIGKIDDGVNQIPTYCNGFEINEIDVPFLNSKECGYGDEVIVQIRKK